MAGARKMPPRLLLRQPRPQICLLLPGLPAAEWTALLAVVNSEEPLAAASPDLSREPVGGTDCLVERQAGADARPEVAGG